MDPVEALESLRSVTLESMETLDVLKDNLVSDKTSAEDTLLALITFLRQSNEFGLRSLDEQIAMARGEAPPPKPRHLRAVTEESAVRGHHRPPTPIRRAGGPAPVQVVKVAESPAPQGATCVSPWRLTLDDGRSAGPSLGIDPSTLPKCGKPAVVVVTHSYTDGSTSDEPFCQDCRPRYAPEVARAFGLKDVPLIDECHLAPRE